MNGRDLSELWGAAMFAVVIPWAIAVNAYGVYMLLTGKDTKTPSQARDSAEVRHEWRWFLLPLTVTFVASVGFIIYAFMTGDGSWFK